MGPKSYMQILNTIFYHFTPTPVLLHRFPSLACRVLLPEMNNVDSLTALYEHSNSLDEVLPED